MRRLTLLGWLALPGVLMVACGDDAKPGSKGNGGTSGRAGGTYQHGGEEADAGRGGQGAGDADAGGTQGQGATGGTAEGPGGTGQGEGANAPMAGADSGIAGEGNGGSGGEAGGPVMLTVTTNADVHSISPLIYGVNPAHNVTCSNATANFSLCRQGGNPWSTYNWENNASNAGNDSMLCSENNDDLGVSNAPADTVLSLIDEVGDDAAAVVTVPMLDYVAADKTSGTAYPLCSGDIRKSANYTTTRLRQNQATKGAAFADPPDASDAVVSQDEFLSFVKARSGTTEVLLTLDNQPELWGQTHVALHPAHATYDEVVARNVEYAKMIRKTWPGAEITGYGGYGYYAFLNLQDAPSHPDAEFLDYYLASMKAASDAAKAKLIDYLDIHWYPEFTDTAEERVQAPRSLWDPEWIEDSWIGDSVGAIELVPWLQDKIDAYYPDTKIAISSYAYGGVDDPTGAVAVADALGVFGRENVGLAALQPQEGNNTYNVAAVGAYRNYDGAGSTFGDKSVRATSSDVGSVSVYASIDSQVSNRVVIVAINRNPEATAVSLEVEHAATFSSADVYLVSEAAAGPVAAAGLTSAGSNVFETNLPGYSVSVIVPAI